MEYQEFCLKQSRLATENARLVNLYKDAKAGNRLMECRQIEKLQSRLLVHLEKLEREYREN